MLYDYFRISKKYDHLDKIIFVCLHANDNTHFISAIGNQISYSSNFIKIIRHFMEIQKHKFNAVIYTHAYS